MSREEEIKLNEDIYRRELVLNIISKAQLILSDRLKMDLAKINAKFDKKINNALNILRLAHIQSKPALETFEQFAIIPKDVKEEGHTIELYDYLTKDAYSILRLIFLYLNAKYEDTSITEDVENFLRSRIKEPLIKEKYIESLKLNA